MYKEDFGSSGYFEQDPKEIEEYIQFYDDADKLYKFFDAIKNHTLKLLIDAYDNIEQDLWEIVQNKESKTLKENQLDILGKMITYKLGLGFQIPYALDKLHEELQLIERSFGELAKYKDHRHKVGEGHYSEKPAY